MNDRPAPRGIQSWEIAEQNAAAWMRYWGFVDARVTAGGSDGGIDVRSSRAVAQVKDKGSAIGSPEVQRLIGAGHGHHGKTLIFFARAGYSMPAVEAANRAGVALFTYDVVTGAMAPANGVARRVGVPPRVAPPSQTATVSNSPTQPSRPAIGSGPKKGIGWPMFGAFLFIFCGIAALVEKPKPGETPVSPGYAVAFIVAGVICLLVAASRRIDVDVPQPPAPRHTPVVAPVTPGPAATRSPAPEPSMTAGQAYAATVAAQTQTAPGFASFGDVNWFDYVMPGPDDDSLSDAFIAIHDVMRSDVEPDFDENAEAQTVIITIYPGAKSGYLGLKSISARFEEVGREDPEVFRVHWSTKSEARPEDAERAADDAHEAAGRANRILADYLGGWIKHGGEK